MVGKHSLLKVFRYRLWMSFAKFAESVGKCARLILFVACTISSMSNKLFAVTGLPAEEGIKH